MPKPVNLKKLMRSVKRDDIAAMRKSLVVNLRISPKEKTRLVEAAQLCGLSLSEFLIQTGLYAAEKLDKGKKS